MRWAAWPPTMSWCPITEVHGYRTALASSSRWFLPPVDHRHGGIADGVGDDGAGGARGGRVGTDAGGVGTMTVAADRRTSSRLRWPLLPAVVVVLVQLLLMPAGCRIRRRRRRRRNSCCGRVLPPFWNGCRRNSIYVVVAAAVFAAADGDGRPTTACSSPSSVPTPEAAT